MLLKQNGETSGLKARVRDVLFDRGRFKVTLENGLVIHLDDPEAHNPDILRALVGAGADVQFVGELRHSLEDVYLQLMKDN